VITQTVGLQKLLAKFKQLAEAARRQGIKSVAVGYSAPYALYVHENREIWPPGMRLKGKPRPSGKGRYWDPQNYARPKFLEEPARQLESSGELARVIRKVTQQTGDMTMGMLAAGLRIQHESQRYVPVENGVLLASAFTKLDSK